VSGTLSRIHLLVGDLTESDADAIVNAANNDLQLGGGVAGAIRRKGGDTIQQECNAIGSIPVGGAAITSGGRLKARFVIHAASMELGGRTEAPALRSSTAHSLRIASERGLRSIAFPAVGTGIAGFPMRECAELMLRECVRHFAGETTLERIGFVLYDDEALAEFERVLTSMKRESAAAGAK
jgi:O-acetyl-ADP-ribose deacetylase (regulator of RNase III)